MKWQPRQLRSDEGYARAPVINTVHLFVCRRIWEAGNKAEGQGVVGVVGAAHVKGIQARWDDAGSPETAKKVAEYCGTDALALPTQAGPWINMAAGKPCPFFLLSPVASLDVHSMNSRLSLSVPC